MAQVRGTHAEYEFEMFWNVQDRTLYWGAVIYRDGHVVSRPHGQLPQAALEDEDEAAVRALVIQSIDENLDVAPPKDI